MTWWHRLLRREALEDQLDQELRYHFDRRVEDHIRLGLDERDARRRTRLEFGGLEQIKEDCRDARGTRWVEALVQDARFALRLLTVRRSFTALAAVVLAVGIAVNGVFFTLVEMICLRGLPLHDVHRLMYIGGSGGRTQAMSYLDFEGVRQAELGALPELAAFVQEPMAVSEEDRVPDRVTGAYLSVEGFRILRAAPIIGRDLSIADGAPGAPAVALISHRLWQSRYQRNPTILGRTVRVNGTPTTLIGVMPEDFRFPTNVDLWQPLSRLPERTATRRDVRSAGVFGRLADGATRGEAQGQIDAVAARLSRLYPATNENVEFTVRPINDRYNGDISNPVWLAFISAGGLILVIACTNLANLLLMRSTQRAREIAIRASLGATRRRVIRQLLTESTLLAVIGGCVGLGLSFGGLWVLARIVPQDVLPFWMDFGMNGPILTALVGVCLSTALVFGLVPALHLSRIDLTGVLKDGARSDRQGFRSRRWTKAFLTFQFALTVVLLAQLSQAIRLSLQGRSQDPTIDMSNLLTMSITLGDQPYGTPAARVAFYERFEGQLKNRNGIASIAVTSALPFGGGQTREIRIDGAPINGTAETARVLRVGVDYFRTLGLTVLRGRAFDDRDGTPGYQNAIVNQRFVESFLAGGRALGRRIQLPTAGEPTPWLTVVGVSPSVRQSPAPEPDPVVYLPYRAEAPPTVSVVVRGQSGSIASLVREEVRTLDADLPLYRIMTLEQAANEFAWNGRVSSLLLNTITAIALALSAVGLYTVTSHSVAQRTAEIGVRMAVGAEPRQLRSLVLAPAFRQVGIAFGVGLLCTLAWERAFAVSTASTTLSDPLSLALTAAALVMVATIACLVPMRRATRLDPVIALRYE